MTPDLTGRTILVTRAASQAEEFVRAIVERNGRAVLFPMIEIAPPHSWEALDKALDSIERYQGLLFASANGAEGFFHRTGARGTKPEILAQMTVYAVGPRTKEALERHGLTVHCIPEQYTAADLVVAIAAEELAGKRFLFPRGNLGTEVLAQGLRSRGALVECAEVYRTIQPAPADVETISAMLKTGGVDLVTFASPSAVRHFAALFPDETMRSIARRTAFAAIGPVTASALEAAGVPAQVVAPHSTMEALLEAIVGYFQKANVQP